MKRGEQQHNSIVRKSMEKEISVLFVRSSSCRVLVRFTEGTANWQILHIGATGKTFEQFFEGIVSLYN